MDINERLDKLEKRLSSVENLTSSGTGNEMRFFIFDYEPKYEILVRERTKNLLKNRNDILQVDLYETMIDVINEFEYMNDVLNMEKQNDVYDKKTILNEVIQPLLRIQSDDSPYLDKFRKIEDDGSKIILLTGAGKTYPFVRSHTVLNNLQSIFKNNPVVLLYPGSYNLNKSMTLKLFDVLNDDNYYRAFPLVER